MYAFYFYLFTMTVYESMEEYTSAKFLQDTKVQTPVFVRFSTVAGSRGSADTPRDVRGFAVKFYTEDGNFDLVGNNIPSNSFADLLNIIVFFIQDAIKFPDLIHSVKPEPHNEIPQAASAHDTFYGTVFRVVTYISDFISLTPEATHMLMWVMSDRAFPRTLADMEGFGVHTFRLVNKAGKARFVKFHWKPVGKAVHSLVWDEAQKVCGKDADFNRRALFDAIEAGDFPEWEFGVQVVEEGEETKFDFDILDPTKLIPEELVPVKKIGKMVLNRNPDNYFSETEQVAFHPGHVVPGIDFSNDPLLQGRLFSYIDTQISRIGANFAELPINLPVGHPVRNNQRDARGRIFINKGRVSYYPNTLAKGCPMQSPDGFKSYSEKMEGWKVRERSKSFGDHFSQASMFWNSISQWEKDHLADAISFELNMVSVEAIRAKVVNELLLNVNTTFAAIVSSKTGIPITGKNHTASAKVSPALSMNRPATSISGRKVGVLVAAGVNEQSVQDIKSFMANEKVTVHVIAATPGKIGNVVVDKVFPNAPSVLYDAVIIPDGRDSATALNTTGLAIHFIKESFVHGKPIGGLGFGTSVIHRTGIPVDPSQGVITDGASFHSTFIQALKNHRFFNRKIDGIDA
jgi:catalase